jgi:hypothetical protein
VIYLSKLIWDLGRNYSLYTLDIYEGPSYVIGKECLPNRNNFCISFFLCHYCPHMYVCMYIAGEGLKRPQHRDHP